jgi:chromate reductase
VNPSLHILGISGSLRRGSFNSNALRAARELALDSVTIEIADLSDIPLYNQDEEQQLPASVVALKRRIRAADAILVATPEYNYTIPGVLKNAIDWTSRPYGDNSWDGKPAAILGASTGAIGTARAQYDLRKIFVNLNVFPINRPEVMIANAASRFDAAGKLTDEQTRDFIRQLVANLAAWTRRLALASEQPLTR